ncbi:DNA polymerase III subunit delta [Corynebacterium pseudopelargi]|uniref:DNA-directed DNA polymerase n=1 Tax=Corynebacterium pseudopelargi TaxID=2080757 RepID=A0A3G6IT17_9CORY|nr:DNA polymerase III subunit delta [Corynebacterium pseudopelargi]AZA08753.1 hypothetical protein CPPEL_03110 [Corynebacterium pseudopelargi]
MSQAIAPVHLVLGDDEFLRERARIAITSSIAEHSEATVSRVRAGEITQSELLELLSPSLFAEQRVIVIEHLEDAGKEPAQLVLEAASNPIDGMYLIICHAGGGRQKAMVPKLKKLAQVHEVAKLKPNERPAWVTAEFRNHGVNPTPDVIHALLDGVGSDLRELASAVSQLVSDNPDGVDASTVRAFYNGIAEVSGFDIADLAVSGQTARAVASTRRALQLGVSPVALATALSMKVGAVARLYGSWRINSRELAGELGMAPFIVEKTSKVARRWSGDAVSKAVILMAELDATVKGQGGDPEFAIEDAVRRVSQLAG